LPETENHGVPGSSPGPATFEMPAKHRKNRKIRAPRIDSLRALTATVLQPVLGEQRIHLFGGLALHVRQHVGICVQGDSDVGVT
jgi:hypothetical protein